MRKPDLMTMIYNYITEMEKSRHTGKISIDINMSQGGFGNPDFYQKKKEVAKPLTNGLKFVIVE